MYCFRCGSKLPPRVVNCPDCDTPQKRRQRYRHRMILGLIIFLAGAAAGSLFDTFFFKGRAWEHSFLGILNTQENASQTAALPVVTGRQPALDVPVDESLTLTATDKLTTDAGQAVASGEAPEFQEAPAARTAADADSVGAEAVATISEIIPAIASAPAVQTQVPEAGAPESSSPAGRLVYKSFDVLEKEGSSSYHGSLAQDGSELIFSSNRIKINGKNTYQCFIKKPVASEKPRRVFEWPGNVWTPELTPDGARIVFSSDSVSTEHLFIYDRKTGRSKALTRGDSKNMMCAVSPNGRMVAFTSGEKGKANNIWLIGIDGDDLLQLTFSAEDDREPRWSADGSTLYFTRIYTYMKKSHIMKIRLDPLGDAEVVVDNGHRNWLPDVSPDGSLLAYVRSESKDGSKNVLVLRRLDSGEETVIKPLGEADCLRPIWTSDSSGMVFHATVNNTRNLYFARFKREMQAN